MELKDKEFWQQVYISAVRSGKFNREAEIIADIALDDLREKFEDYDDSEKHD